MLRDEEFESALSAARTGADWAWREIYEADAPVVLGYLRGRRAADPDDLTGEVFAQVVRDLGGFEGDRRAFRAWLLTIARNRLFDERRRRARRPEQPHPDPTSAVEAGGGIAADAADDAHARMELERVTRMLAALSDDQRDVVLLRIIGDLSLEEVARVVGKRRGAVKQLQRRGLAALRKRLEQERMRG